jgi:hypothetical protein
VREALTDHRSLFLRRPGHLSEEQQAQVATLLASSVGSTVSAARCFLTDWYAFWRDDTGQKRSLDETQGRYEAWRQEERYAELPPLRRVQGQIPLERFAHLSQFLRHPAWEATNNGAERAGRVYRHRQGPLVNLRSEASIDGALKVRVRRRRETAGQVPHPLASAAAAVASTDRVRAPWQRRRTSHTALLTSSTQSLKAGYRKLLAPRVNSNRNVAEGASGRTVRSSENGTDVRFLLSGGRSSPSS